MKSPNTSAPASKPDGFTGYQMFMIAVIAFIQFTVILDFMVLSPLSAVLLDELKIGPDDFSIVVSAYAFSAGISGLIAAFFADLFDRKRLLIFFYAGFVLGTALCALADSYWFLLFARIFTGVFGGVIGSIAFAIITDLFRLEQRGRVMGIVQMAFAVSQILGLPIGLYLANRLNWHAPFWMIVGVSIVAGVMLVVFMKPVDAHLKLPERSNPIVHMFKTITNLEYLQGFGATILLATGGYMLMPLGAAYGTNNLGIDIEDLPLMYLITGLCTVFVGPLSGRLADKWGRYKVFVVGCVIAMAMVAWYTNLGITPFWIVTAINIILFVGLTARMIAASAMVSGLPAQADRGAFMSINSSLQQISGGVAAAIAGQIVVQQPDGQLLNYPILGIVVLSSFVATIFLFGNVNRIVLRRSAKEALDPQKMEPAVE